MKSESAHAACRCSFVFNTCLVKRRSIYFLLLSAVAILQVIFFVAVLQTNSLKVKIIRMSSTFNMGFGQTSPSYEQLLLDASKVYRTIHKPKPRNCRHVHGETSYAEENLWNRSVLISGNFNGNITKHNRVLDTFLKAPAMKVYLTSAYVRNRETLQQGLTVSLNSWEFYKHQRHTMHCCLLNKDGTLTTVPALKEYHYKTMKRLNSVTMRALQYKCIIRGNMRCAEDHPIGVTLVYKADSCVLPNGSSLLSPNGPSYKHSLVNGSQVLLKGGNNTVNTSKSVQFLRLNYPVWRGANSIGLCAKILYGDFYYHRLIEWIEIYKHLGVDKIVIFYYNLDVKTKKVLHHYASDGFLDIHPFDFPQPNNPKRYVGQKRPSAWNDEQLTVYECEEHLQGYHYAGIFDTDEIVLPKPGIKDLKQLLSMLLLQNPKASDFYFSSELFILEWGDHDDTPEEMNGFYHTRFQRRTRPMLNRIKNFHLPSRIVPGSISTHHVFPMDGYSHIHVKSSLASIKHYRACPPAWCKTNKCNKFKRYLDNSVNDLLHQLNDKITYVTHKLFG